MSRDSDSSDFEDEVLQENEVRNVVFNGGKILGDTDFNTPKAGTVDSIKQKIDNLIARNVNKQVTMMLEHLKDNDNDDITWNDLIGSVKKCPIEFIRECFDMLFEHFPSNGRLVRTYCEIEEKNKNYDIVEKTLEENLPYCANVELWTYSCEYKRKRITARNGSIEEKEALDQVEKAYSEAVDAVGFFMDSGDLWKSYHDFLRTRKPNENIINAKARYMKTMRDFFCKTVIIPFTGCDDMWSTYQVFEENCVGRNEKPEAIQQQVEKMKQPLEQPHKLAMDVHDKRNENWQLIVADALPFRILDEKAMKQSDLWIEEIMYDLSNPMKLPQEQFYHQMHATYIRCLSCCTYCPDIWMDFAQFEARYSWERAVQVLERAIQVMPNSMFLRLACCDFLELYNHPKTAVQYYEKMVVDLPISISWIHYLQFTRRSSGVVACRELFKRARESLCTPELYVAEADIESKVNREDEVGLHIFQAGMNHFASNTCYILSFCDYLLYLKKVEDACKLLETSIEKVKKEEQPKLWDKIFYIRSRFGVLSPLSSIYKLEEEYRMQLPSKQNAHVVEDMARYSLWGCNLKAEEDKVLLKRKFPITETKEDDLEIKKAKFDRSLLSVGDNGEKMGSIEIPDWFKRLRVKLPQNSTLYARGSKVDEIMDILEKNDLPTRADFVV